MLEFCYRHEYGQIHPEYYTASSLPLLEGLLDVLIVADKYMVPALTNYSISKVGKAIVQGPSEVFKFILKKAYGIEHPAFKLVKAMLVTQALMICENTAPRLQFEMIELIETIDHYPEFGADLAKRAIASESTLFCPP